MGENDVEFAQQLGDLQGRVKSLEEYQKTQNGALVRLADRVDSLGKTGVGILVSFTVVALGLIGNFIILLLKK